MVAVFVHLHGGDEFRRHHFWNGYVHSEGNELRNAIHAADFGAPKSAAWQFLRGLAILHGKLHGLPKKVL